MKYIALILLVTMLCGCDTNKCQVSCIGSIALVAVGYTKAELNGAAIGTYGKDGQFDNLISAGPMSSGSYSDWQYPSVTDTTTDTLLCIGSVGYTNDYEITIPGENTIKITGITLGGQLSVTDYCNEGGTPTGAQCTGPTYIQSYTVNGVQVSPSHTVTLIGQNYAMGYIYIVK